MKTIKPAGGNAKIGLILVSCFLLVILAAIVFEGKLTSIPPVVFQFWYLDVIKYITHPSIQVYVVVAMGLYVFVPFSDRCFSSLNPMKGDRFWQLMFASLVMLEYLLTYESSSRTVFVLKLFTGMLFGRLVGLVRDGWVKYRPSRHFIRWASLAICCMLSIACFLAPTGAETFYDHHRVRWNGIWGNPNICGLLMGVGGVLAVGFANRELLLLKNKRTSRSSLFWLFAFTITAGVELFGLWRTGSRGALLAAFAAFLAVCALKRVALPLNNCSAAIATNRVVFYSILSLSVIIFVASGASTWKTRAMTGFDQNDFSASNRISAWRGSMQMMSEHLLLGVGCSRAEPFYAGYYAPTSIQEYGAFGMNDFLFIGTSFGFVALVSFLVYLTSVIGSLVSVIGSSTQIDLREEKSQLNDAIYCQSLCQAGAMSLAVGFWFDGGLFTLVTGSIFWSMLELGRRVDYNGDLECAG